MNGRLRHGLAATLVVAAWSGCSDKKSEPSDVPDAAAAESLVDDDKLSDREQLLACEVEEPCLEGLAQRADLRPFTINSHRMTCIFRALAERKPGRYEHHTESASGDGSMGTHHVLLVHADGTASYARRSYADYRNTDLEETEYPGQRCTLRDPSFFTDCFDAVLPVEQGDVLEGLAWECSYGDDSKVPVELDWFESCEPAPAACE